MAIDVLVDKKAGLPATPADAVRTHAHAIDAVLFDLGDTLLHFETDQARRFLESATRPVYDRVIELGFRPPPYAKYLRAIKKSFLYSYVWSRLTHREVRLLRTYYRMHHRMGIEINDAQMIDLAVRCVAPCRQFFKIDAAAQPVMARLEAAGLKLALVSNTVIPGCAIDDVLHHEKLLEHFPIRVYSSEVGYMKPHRRIFETALDRLGVPPDRAVFVGDHIDKDVRGASRLGMKTILLAKNGHTPQGRGHPNLVIRALSDVPIALQV